MTTKLTQSLQKLENLTDLDGTAALFLGALAPHCGEPRLIARLQRSLMLVGGRAPKTAFKMDALYDALLDLDDEPTARGLTRLLRTSPAEDAIEYEISQAEQDADLTLEQLAHAMVVADDLSEAFSISGSEPAACLFVDSLISLASPRLRFDDPVSLGISFIAHRGIETRIKRLYSLRPYLTRIDDEALELASAMQLESSFAIWTLSHRVSRNRPFSSTADRDGLDRLLRQANSTPIEVFDAADLLRKNAQ